MSRNTVLTVAVLSACLVTVSPVDRPADAACCYFSAKEKDVLQPAQKAFITWDPKEKKETFTVQPKFEGNADDFGMVIPTPAQPTLDEMPRDFFKALAVFTILKQRVYPESKWMAEAEDRADTGAGPGTDDPARTQSTVRVLEAGVVGSLDYKVLSAAKADDLFQWLKDNNYTYAGDQETLDHYVQKRWFFTVMKIDPKQMKKRPDGSYEGEVTPTRFTFNSEQLVYPLRITRISVKDHTEALFYIQAPHKVDLPEEMTYQYQWVPMLQNAQGWYAKGIFGPSNGLPGRADEWVKAIEGHIPGLLKRGEELGFNFTSGQRPQPNREGRTATTLEWARRLTDEDIKVLTGEAPYTETVPDVDEGFTAEQFHDPKTAQQAYKAIGERIERLRKDRPGGYLVREAPEADVRNLRLLKGHLQTGRFVTKLRKTFTPDEMHDDLVIVPAALKGQTDESEYTEILPTSPP